MDKADVRGVASRIPMSFFDDNANYYYRFKAHCPYCGEHVVYVRSTIKKNGVVKKSFFRHHKQDEKSKQCEIRCKSDFTQCNPESIKKRNILKLMPLYCYNDGESFSLQIHLKALPEDIYVTKSKIMFGPKDNRCTFLASRFINDEVYVLNYIPSEDNSTFVTDTDDIYSAVRGIWGIGTDYLLESGALFDKKTRKKVAYGGFVYENQDYILISSEKNPLFNELKSIGHIDGFERYRVYELNIPLSNKIKLQMNDLLNRLKVKVRSQSMKPDVVWPPSAMIKGTYQPLFPCLNQIIKYEKKTGEIDVFVDDEDTDQPVVDGNYIYCWSSNDNHTISIGDGDEIIDFDFKELDENVLNQRIVEPEYDVVVENNSKMISTNFYGRAICHLNNNCILEQCSDKNISNIYKKISKIDIFVESVLLGTKIIEKCSSAHTTKDPFLFGVQKRVNDLNLRHNLIQLSKENKVIARSVYQKSILGRF